MKSNKDMLLKHKELEIQKIEEETKDALKDVEIETETTIHGANARDNIIF